MNKRLQGFLAGVLCCSLFAGISVFAKNTTETIQATFRNIKVYKDNVLCQLKDANGTSVEPFIYNGTTYLPVRGTAELAGMDVTWDGATQSVYLWDKTIAENTLFLEACPPYENNFSLYKSTEGTSFSMAGEKYSDGMVSGWQGAYALSNLNGKYATLNCTIGHVTDNQIEKVVSFIVDGKVIKEITLEAECLPKKVSIPINNGLQIKILYSSCTGAFNYGNGSTKVGIGNMTVE